MNARWARALVYIKAGLPDGTDVEEWISDPNWEILFSDSMILESVAHAQGWLEGCADAYNQTVLELVDGYDATI